MIDVLDRVAADFPDVEAYVEGQRRLTYLEFAARSSGVAALLQEQGVVPGDVVAMRLPSCLEYALVYLGAVRLGAVATGLNPRLGRREVEGIVAGAGPRVIVLDDDGSDMARDRVPVVLSRHEVAGAPAGDPGWRPVDLSQEDPVAIVWTSGTTGAPKGAVFDHANLEALSRATGEISAPFDRRLSPVPFAHVGYMTRLWDELGNAMTSVIVPTPWTARASLDLLESERVTVGQGVPTQWELILREPDLEREGPLVVALDRFGRGTGPGVACVRTRANLLLSSRRAIRDHGGVGDLRDAVQRPAGRHRTHGRCALSHGRIAHRRR